MTDNKEHIARGMLRYAIQGLQDNPEVLLSDEPEVALDEVLNEHLAAAVALVEALAGKLHTVETPTLPAMIEAEKDPAGEDTGTEVPIPPGGDRQADVLSEGRDTRMVVTGDQEMATEARAAASEAAEPAQPTESPLAREEIVETAESPTPGERKRPQDSEVETATGAAPSSPTSGTLGPSSPIKLNTRPGAIPPAPAKRVAPPPPRTSFKTQANAKVGEVYDVGIQTTSVSGAKVEIVECQVPPEIGITYDSESGRLRGTPSAAGEYTLQIRYRFVGSVERAILEGTAALVVIADPRTLWKDLSSSRDAPDWKPDEASLSTKAAYGLQIAAASKRGRSHAHVGAFRDDDFCVEVNPKGPWNILAVADGAGSAPRSRRGSQIASQQAVRSIKEALTGAPGQEIETAAARWIQSKEDRRALDLALYNVLGGAAFSTVKALEEAAASASYPAKDYATTLLLAVHRQSEFGHLVASYWLGDGAIGLYSQERGVELLGRPDGGEFAGQTRFLDRSMVSSGQAIMNRIHVTVVDEFTALLLMTDGVSDPKFGADTNLSDRTRWDQLWEEIEPLLKDDKAGQRLLEWLDFWSVGDHDDRTIAVLW